MDRSALSHPYRTFEFAGSQQAAKAYADTFELATRLDADTLLDAVNARPAKCFSTTHAERDLWRPLRQSET